MSSCCVGVTCMRLRMLRAVQQTAVALTVSAIRAPSLQSARPCHSMQHSSQSAVDRTATSPTRLRAGPCLKPAGLSRCAFGATAGAGDANGRMWTASNGLRARERFGTLCSVASWHAEQHAAWHVAWHAACDSNARSGQGRLETANSRGTFGVRRGSGQMWRAVVCSGGPAYSGPFPLRAVPAYSGPSSSVLIRCFGGGSATSKSSTSTTAF